MVSAAVNHDSLLHSKVSSTSACFSCDQRGNPCFLPYVSPRATLQGPETDVLVCTIRPRCFWEWILITPNKPCKEIWARWVKTKNSQLIYRLVSSSSCLHGNVGWNMNRYTRIITHVHTQTYYARNLNYPTIWSKGYVQALGVLAESCTDMGGQASCKHICVISSQITLACGIIWKAQMQGMHHSSLLYREAFRVLTRGEMHWITTRIHTQGELIPHTIS